MLTSQDIASTIVQAGEGNQWLIIISQQDSERALAAINQYKLENRRWSWRQELPWSGAVFHWGALPCCALLVFFFALEAFRQTPMRAAGAMDNAAVLAGQWWRLFTAVTLHADVGHLATNVTIGFLLFGLAMARFGPGLGLLASFMAGVAGNLLGILTYPMPHRSLGASGMIMGSLGLMTAQSLALLGLGRYAPRQILPGILAGLMLFVLLGLNPDSDIVAHAGGFIAGGLFGAVLSMLPYGFLQKTWLNIIAALLLALWITAAWLIALSRYPVQ